MSISDEVALSSGADDWNTKAVAASGWRSVRLSDGPHGLRVQDPDAASLDIRLTQPATCFPPAVALGSTWNPELVASVGQAIGLEASFFGVDVVLGPGINIKRSPLCGRNFEYFSEDPYVSGELGLAMVRGLQKSGVGACVKHFAVNNQETDRMRVDARVDERTLREIYLPAFERVVKGAKPWMLMSSYNSVNGSPMSENSRLLTGILRDEWGFEGVVVSDWGAVYDRVRAVAAGLDLEMPHADDYSDALLQRAVDAGEVHLQHVERAAARVLQLTERVDRARSSRIRPSDLPDHHALAVEAARQSIVLLKNEGGVLPLSDAPIAILGDFAESPRYQGAGSSYVTPTRVESALGLIREHHEVHFVTDAFSPERRAAALEASRASECAVLFLGLPEDAESEGYDRRHIDLPDQQIDLLIEVSKVANRVVVVLTNGGVVSTQGWGDFADAIVEGWLLGQGGGRAIAEVLLGLHNPSGRLAETIPLRLQDSPSYLNFPGHDGVVSYGERVFVGYRGFLAADTPVAYPFGHGLSYTRFSYATLELDVADGGAEVRCDVSFTVENTGTRSGAEVAQVYVGPPSTSNDRPPMELRGFARTHLDSGGSALISVELDARAFSRWDQRRRRWVVEQGLYDLWVGASSGDIRLHGQVLLQGDEDRRELSPESTLDEWMSDLFGRRVLERSAALGPFVRELSGRESTTAQMIASVPLEKVTTIFGLRSADVDIAALSAEANATARSTLS